MIELHGVRVAYGKTLALDDLTLSLHPGITGLFGPNGAGKSTMLRVIAGLLRPDRGTISFDARVLDIGDEDVRRQIAYVGHATGLYRHLTVGENLLLFARLYGVDEHHVARALAAVGLVDRESSRIDALSAGLKRRAAIARALLTDPKVLLLDEPYANLDDEASEMVSAAIMEWRDPAHYAVIATHGAKRVKSFADASLILQHGHAVSYRLRAEEEVQS